MSDTPPAAGGNIISDAEMAGVDVFSGIKNVFGFVKSGIATGARVAAAGSSNLATDAIDSVVANLENMVTGDGGAAVKAIETFIADIEAKRWGHVPHDAEACLKTGFAILSRFGVNLPVASAVIEALPDIPAI